MMCTGCTFSNNQAPVGGAVDLRPNTWAGFSQYVFINNKAVRAGSEAGCRCAAISTLLEDCAYFHRVHTNYPILVLPTR